MKRMGTILLVIVLVILALAIIIGLARTYKTQTSPNQAKFLKGTTPDPALNAFYQGSVTGYKGEWQGKQFDSTASTGINIFQVGSERVERYPFKTSVANGLRDDINVVRIDYDVPENAFWVRWVLDEVVQVESGKYLGKIHLRVIPGLPFTIGYFYLSS